MKLKTMIVMVGIIAFVSSSTFAQDTVVKEFSGSGGRNTRPFTVKNGWEIQWDAKGDIFQLFLYTANGDTVGIPANQQGSGKGSSYQAKGGQYYLQVNAIGNWNIQVVQTESQSFNAEELKNKSEATSSEIATFSGSGGRNTRPFMTNGPWEIQWDAKGDIFQLFLYTANGDTVGIPANQQGSGKGTSFQPKAGKYYLQVNAIGNWSMKIVPARQKNSRKKQANNRINSEGKIRFPSLSAGYAERYA